MSYQIRFRFFSSDRSGRVDGTAGNRSVLFFDFYDLKKMFMGLYLLKCDFHDLQGIGIIRQVFERFSVHWEWHGFISPDHPFQKYNKGEKTWLVEFFPLHWLQL